MKQAYTSATVNINPKYIKKISESCTRKEIFTYLFLLRSLQMPDQERIFILLGRASALEEVVKSQADEFVLLKTGLAYYKSGRHNSNSHLPHALIYINTPPDFRREKSHPEIPVVIMGIKFIDLEKKKPLIK